MTPPSAMRACGEKRTCGGSVTGGEEREGGEGGSHLVDLAHESVDSAVGDEGHRDVVGVREVSGHAVTGHGLSFRSDDHLPAGEGKRRRECQPGT
jgi:hypothetical protein